MLSDPGSALVWFRRDLRSDDHAAFAAALAEHDQVYCVFVFDRDILELLPRADRRVEFIWHAVEELHAALSRQGGGLIVRHGRPVEIIPALAKTLGVSAVYVNRDYEPVAIARDEAIAAALRRTTSADLRISKDQVIFDREEVRTQAGTPFGVFTPYKNAWLKRLETGDIAERVVAPRPGQLQADTLPHDLPSLAELGFTRTNLAELPLPTGMSGAQRLFADFLERMDDYAARRDFPALKGPSYLSTHLRFGTLSVRQLVRHAVERRSQGADIWLSELIWREFYQMILWQHPQVVGRCYKPQFDTLRWLDAPEQLLAWQQGKTGYPLVDAAMRQLAHSGYMHNRLRMVTASFLCKDLELDWRLGEAWFAEHLLDFDLAANNGGWQWAASTGCDAQPWFRIFNPVRQSERFDAHGQFIRRYVPELTSVPEKFIHAPWTWSGFGKLDYPPPIVDHAVARTSTLARYKLAAGATSAVDVQEAAR
ncbi:MAG: deoxyribodipyrimidine photo-lyase [Rhodocyclaceae bacterium]|nr:deoxyribodipyrimidine photo-lyase [Rhodocyclaceae bacterium]